MYHWKKRNSAFAVEKSKTYNNINNINVLSLSSTSSSSSSVNNNDPFNSNDNNNNEDNEEDSDQQVLPISTSLDNNDMRTQPIVEEKGDIMFPVLMNTSSSISITERLELKSRFDRWKFLQDILEGDVNADDINQIVYQILQSNMNHSSSPLKVLNEEEKLEIIDRLFRYNENGEGIVLALIHNDNMVIMGSDKVWDTLKGLLPTMEEDEESFKCGWDLIVELYGREATKISQKSGNPLWNAYADIVRLLIYLDFLSDGIIQEPFS